MNIIVILLVGCWIVSGMNNAGRYKMFMIFLLIPKPLYRRCAAIITTTNITMMIVIHMVASSLAVVYPAVVGAAMDDGRGG